MPAGPSYSVLEALILQTFGTGCFTGSQVPILVLLALRYSHKEIGAQLGLDRRTVTTQLARAVRSVGVKDAESLIRQLVDEMLTIIRGQTTFVSAWLTDGTDSP